MLVHQNELIRRGMESLLEDERLRSGLTDAAARSVFAWAEIRVAEAANRATSTVEPQEVLSYYDAALGQIRLIMRRINHLTGDRDVIDDSEMRDSLSELATAAGRGPVRDEINQIVAVRRELDSEGFVERLIRLVSGEP